MNPRTFQVAVPDSLLEDLRERLVRTRWPADLDGPDGGWRAGASLPFLQKLARHWLDELDWRRVEARINALPNYLVDIDGITLHYVHVRGNGPHPMPIVLSHGWPGSFLQMFDLIERLADPSRFGGSPDDAFDVVVPSLPGFGFSSPAAGGSPMTKRRIAKLFVRLMCEVLGHDRFAAHGGDIGSGITSMMGLEHPEALIGIHVMDVIRPFLGEGSAPLTSEERRYLEEERLWYQREGAYDYLQSTKPLTLAYGLHDSPVALAAWIVEKFHGWSDCGGDITSRFSFEDLLANVTLYWVTGTAQSSVRLYFDRERSPDLLRPEDRIRVPTAIAIFAADIDHPPREWAERSYDLRQWTEIPRGGHFASMEEPELLADDIHRFFRSLRT